MDTEEKVTWGLAGGTTGSSQIVSGQLNCLVSARSQSILRVRHTPPKKQSPRFENPRGAGEARLDQCQFVPAKLRRIRMVYSRGQPAGFWLLGKAQGQ